MVFFVVAVLVLRCWLLEGLFSPFRVTSGSMAKTLLGLHREVVCGDCGHRFACAADVHPVSRRAVCPNCGYGENELRSLPDIDGDRLLIEKSIFAFRRPRRWEVVVFRHPHQTSRTVVKRVVGLPGESVQIRDGDVYIDGAIQRKTLAEQRALAVLVYDADFPPTMEPSLPPRWHPDQAGSGWQSDKGRFTRPATSEKQSIDWLSYRHWYRLRGAEVKTQASPITNVRGYSQSRAHRAENVHPVSDVLLSFRLVKTVGRGRLLAKATDGRDEFEVRIRPEEGSYEVLHDQRPLGASSSHGVLPVRLEDVHVEISLIDRQFLLAFEGRPAVVYPYEAANREARPTARPLAIGTDGLGVEICQLRVWRDVYHTRPVGIKGRWGLEAPFVLSEDEYFVLGDNSPISVDSRTWAEGPAVPASLLLGKPLMVHYPARRIEVGGWDFQVPDLAKIRYIR